VFTGLFVAPPVGLFASPPAACVPRCAAIVGGASRPLKSIHWIDFAPAGPWLRVQRIGMEPKQSHRPMGGGLTLAPPVGLEPTTRGLKHGRLARCRFAILPVSARSPPRSSAHRARSASNQLTAGKSSFSGVLLFLVTAYFSGFLSSAVFCRSTVFYSICAIFVPWKPARK